MDGVSQSQNRATGNIHPTFRKIGGTFMINPYFFESGDKSNPPEKTGMKLKIDFQDTDG